MAESTSTQLVLGLTAQIVSAHVSNNAVSRDALPELIQQVFNTLTAAGVEQAEPEKLQPAVPIKKSVFPEYIVCLEDGKKLKIAQASPADFLQHDARTVSRALESAARLPDGCTEIRRTSV